MQAVPRCSLDEDRPELLDHAVVVVDPAQAGVLGEAAAQRGVVHRAFRKALPASRVDEHPVGEVEPVLDGHLVQVEPDHEGEAEGEERPAPVAGEEAADRSGIGPAIGVEGIDVVPPEGGHAQEAGPPGGAAPRDRGRVDDQHGEAPGAEDGGHRAGQRPALGGGGGPVEVDAGGLGAGGARGGEDPEDLLVGDALEGVALEQPHRQPGELVDRGPGPVPGDSEGGEDAVVGRAGAPVVGGQLGEDGEQRRLALGLAPHGLRHRSCASSRR